MITITELTVQQINAALLSIQNGNRSTSRNNSSGNNTISLVNDMDSNFAVCNTSASESSKEVTLENLAELEIGVEIKVLFTNGNTVGSCVGTESNKITSSSAPKLKVNNFNAYPIKVGGEYAGENFVNVGDVHSFVFDGESWNDLTADVIYKGEVTAGNYIKKRNGLITQWKNAINESSQVFIIQFTSIPQVICEPHANSSDSINYYRLGGYNITNTGFTINFASNRNQSWIAIGY